MAGTKKKLPVTVITEDRFLVARPSSLCLLLSNHCDHLHKGLKWKSVIGLQ